jgi:hypothetical protein
MLTVLPDCVTVVVVGQLSEVANSGKLNVVVPL